MKKYYIWVSTTDTDQKRLFIYMLCLGHFSLKYEQVEFKNKCGDL